MRWRRWIYPIAGILLAGTAIWFMFFNNTWSWHQRLTVVVETPAGEKVSSSVTKASLSHHSFVPGSPGGRASGGLRGEAVVVELGSGHYLFALLKLASGGEFHNLAQYVVLSDSEFDLDLAGRGGLLEQVGRRGVVPQDRYPLLVTFGDINDPKTVKKVDPNNLAAAFGPGYALKSITLEITDEPVTEGEIEKVLGWIGKYTEKGARLNGKKCTACPFESENLADLLGAGSFRRMRK